MVFENKYPPEKKLYIQFYRQGVYPAYKVMGGILLLLGFVQLLTVLAGIFGWIDSTLSPSFRIVFFDMSIFIIAIGGLLLAYPSFLGRIFYRKEKKMGSENQIFFDQQITVSRFGRLFRYEYGKIKKIKETKESYIIMFSRNEGCLVKKGAFTVGEEKEFLSFLKAGGKGCIPREKEIQ